MVFMCIYINRGGSVLDTAAGFAGSLEYNELVQLLNFLPKFSISCKYLVACSY